ncbi:hypothetical protein [Nonomuraea sp. NPDC023979]|uniref:hypothetical protein n=1 Tax=Nonomuraea sp. NPDC023979 TaxID=3154796 RepID=UPI0033F2EE3C
MAEPLYPSIVVECMFTDPTWTDISPWLRSASIQRGSRRADSPLTRYDPGEATVVLDNRDRRFDPTNLSGPYVENSSSESGVLQFTCEISQDFGQGWTVDVKSAPGQQAEIVNVSSKASGTTGSFTVAKPVGTLSGHRLIAFHFCDVGTLGAMGTPTGGGSWGTPLSTRSEGDDTLQAKVWAKTAGGSEPASYGFTQASGSDGVVILVAVRNWDTSSSEVVASQSNGGAPVMGTPATTPHASNDLELRVAAGSWGGAFGATWAPPQVEGWVERADIQSQAFTTATLAAKQLTGVGGGTGTRVKPMRPIRVRASMPFTATTNLVKNPSFETGTTGWSSNGTSVIGRESTVSRFGGYTGSVSKTAGSTICNIELVAPHALSVPAGTQVTISAYVLIPAAVIGQLTGVAIADATFDGAISNVFVLPADAAPDVWHRVSTTQTVAPGKTLTRFQLQFWTDGSHATGQVVGYVDAVQVEAAATASPFCDGSQPACSWAGAAHDSTSSRPASVTFDLFHGFADDWLVSWTGDYDSEVTVPCTDGLASLADVDRSAVAAVGAGEDSGARVDRILDSIGWPAADRDIAVGNSTLQATTLEGNGLAELQLVADTEIGELYQDGAGKVVFRNRQALLTDDRSTTPQARFGEGGAAKGRLPYHDVGITYDRTQMANIVRATRVGGIEQTASDAASILEYRRRTFPAPAELLMQTDAEALSWASWLLYLSREPELRFDELTIRPEKDPAALFPQVLGRDIGDRIIVERRPVGADEDVVREVFIRGIEHTIRGLAKNDPRWETRWVLQSAAKVGSFLTLGHPMLGVIGENGLAY